ncbi:hypothetical protein MHK_008684 [Candidatus Magnetomorum sp. HK-1]|nr:hypothetical protein MHK_008684 [Candidatus Magnetomorum sp. HK-1]
MNYLKILISANDVGSALQNIAIINFCELQEINVSFYIISSHLTSHIFDNSGFPVKLISNKCTDKKKIIQNIFKEFKPDFVLAGLSFCNEAIDDIVIEISSELAITNGVIQDYWGYIGNFSNNLLPDFFFVIDKLSVYLTKKKTNGKADCIITGSPKHQMYKIMNFSIKNNKRKKPYLIFIGQPREIPGFIYNLKAFINTLNNFDHKIDIGFKPHPIDYQLENYYIDLFQEQPNAFIEKSINVISLNLRIFLSGTLLEPKRAGITAITSFINFTP